MTERDWDTASWRNGWEKWRWGQGSRALYLQFFRKRHPFEVSRSYTSLNAQERALCENIITNLWKSMMVLWVSV
jgi:hypothetical protein